MDNRNKGLQPLVARYISGAKVGVVVPDRLYWADTEVRSYICE